MQKLISLFINNKTIMRKFTKFLLALVLIAFGTSPMSGKTISLNDVPFYQHVTWGENEPMTTTAGYAWVIGSSTGQPYGDGSVNNFSNLSEYGRLVIKYTEGTPRVMMNRDADNGQYNIDEASSHLIEYPKCFDDGGWAKKYFTVEDKGDYKELTVHLAMIVADKGFAYLNAIKGANWSNVTVTSMEVVEEVSLEDIPFYQHVTWGENEPMTTTVAPAWVIGSSTGQPYGDGSVNNFANLSEYAKLIITYTEGTPRVMMNRDADNGQYNIDAASSHLIEYPKCYDDGGWAKKYFTTEDKGDYKVLTVNLAKIVADKGYAYLNAIKGANWGNVTVTSMELSKIEEVSLEEVPFYQHVTWGENEPMTTTVSPAWVIGTSTGQPYGDGSVNNFANLSEYTKLVITYTDGVPRVMMNRDADNGQYNVDMASSHLIEYPKCYDDGGWAKKYFSVVDNGDSKELTVDLAQIAEDKGYAYLNAIKGANWSNVTVTSMMLYKNANPLANLKKAIKKDVEKATELNTTNPNAGLANIIANAELVLANKKATKQELTDAQELLKAAVNLKSAIDKANATNPAAYNEESFTNMLNAAITADGELADPAATKASLEAALTALQKVVNALVLKNGYSDLTKADYNDGTCDYNLNTDTDMVYGQSGVDKGKYANLIDYDKLIVTVTSGAPRFCFNRETADGTDAENEADSKMIDIPGFAWGSLRYLTVSDDKTVWTIDIQKMGVEKGKVLLHAIKGADGNKVTVTGIYKVNTSNIDVQQQSIGRLKGSDLYPDAGELNTPLTNEDNMALIPTKESKQDIRLWEQADGKVELQIKKGNTFFIQTASEGKAVYRIKFVGNNVKLVCSNGAIEESEKPDYKTVIWNGEIDAVKFWALEDMTLTLVRVYSRPSTTETPIYEPNDDEVAKNVQAALKEALKEAEAVDVKTKTDETVEVFKEALSNARMQDEMKTSIVDVEGARLALKDAIKGLKDKPASGEIIVDLDGAIYHHWSAVSGTAEDQGSANGGVKLNEAVGAGGALWGNLSGAVPYLDYANITDYTEMRFEGTPGAQLRLMTNRLVDEGPIFEKIYTIGDDGKLTVPVSDLKYLNGGADADFVCLQAIKVPWGGSEITLTSAQLVKIVPVDIVEDFDGSFYHNWSAVSGTAEDKGSANGGVKLNEAVGAGGALWGNLSGAVPYLDYANITDYDELRFEGTPGAQLRLMTNRLVDEGPIFEKIYTIGEDGKLTVPVSELKYLNGGADADFVCLQAIKVPWGGSEVTLTAIQIVKKSGAQPTPDEPQYKNDLTKDLFKKWSSIDADATSENTGCDLVLNSEVGPGSMVYGNASVSYLTYANLKGYKQIIINGDAGVQLRVLLNRLEVGNGGGDDNGGALTEVNVTIGEDGKAVVDLTAEELGGNARLNAIKTGWSSETGKIYGFELVKDEIVAVQAVKTEAEEEVIYDLRGQRLTKAVKGINIINGKKVFIK